MTRRYFLAGALTLGTLGLVGCGGGGGAITRMAGRTRAELPDGFSLPASELAGENALGSQALGADGSFSASYLTGAGPIFTWVRHTATDKPVLFGFAGEGQNGVGAKGTAVALIAVAMGIGGMPAVNARQVVALLEADPAVAALAGVIAARVVASPTAVVDGDPAILEALKTAAQALKPTSRAAAIRGRSRAEASPLVSITPGVQSGSNVVQKEEPSSIYYVNNLRRPAVYYTYKTGYADAVGKVTELPAAALVGAPAELPPVTSVLESIFSLNQRTLWAPVEGIRVPLAVQSGAKKTFYQTVCLMASGKSDADGEPSFFSLPRYADEAEAWRTKRMELNQHAWIGGVLYDLFGSLVGGAAVWISSAKVAQVIATVQNAGSAAAQAAVDAGKGLFIKGTETTIEQAALEGDGGVAVRGALEELIVEAQSAGAISRGAQLLNAIRSLAAMLAQAVVVAGALSALLDLSSTYVDLVSSEKGAIWDETLFIPTVTLSASSSKIRAGGNSDLTVAIPGGGSDGYRFKWKVTGGNGVLGEKAAANSGQQIETTTRVVNLLSAPGDPDKLVYTVSVTVLDKTSGATVGSATATVTISADATQTVTVPGTIREIEKEVDPRVGFNTYAMLVAFTPPVGNYQSYTLIGKGTPGGDQWPSGSLKITATKLSELVYKGFAPGDPVVENVFALFASPAVANLSITKSYFQNAVAGWTWEVKCVAS